MAARITLKVFCNFQDYGTLVKYDISITSRDMPIPGIVRQHNMVRLMNELHWDRDIWEWIYAPSNLLMIEENYFLLGDPVD